MGDNKWFEIQSAFLRCFTCDYKRQRLEGSLLTIQSSCFANEPPKWNYLLHDTYY